MDLLALAFPAPFGPISQQRSRSRSAKLSCQLQIVYCRRILDVIGLSPLRIKLINACESFFPPTGGDWNWGVDMRAGPMISIFSSILANLCLLGFVCFETESGRSVFAEGEHVFLSCFSCIGLLLSNVFGSWRSVIGIVASIKHGVPFLYKEQIMAANAV